MFSVDSILSHANSGPYTPAVLQPTSFTAHQNSHQQYQQYYYGQPNSVDVTAPPEELLTNKGADKQVANTQPNNKENSAKFFHHQHQQQQQQQTQMQQQLVKSEENVARVNHGSGLQGDSEAEDEEEENDDFDSNDESSGSESEDKAEQCGKKFKRDDMSRTTAFSQRYIISLQSYYYYYNYYYKQKNIIITITISSVLKVTITITITTNLHVS